MTKKIFITATDTDAGKTVISEAILQLAREHKNSTVGYKPVSAGCEETCDGLRNEDALILQRASSIECAYEMVNPIAFADPVAPHLAAARMQQQITLDEISMGLSKLALLEPDVLLIEGAGGWRLPLGNDVFMSDFVVTHNIPVILIIGLKLGCLNHALLTYQALTSDGVDVVGWVGNQVDPDMLYADENIKSLKQMIDAPCLGIVPHLKNTEDAKRYLQLDFLLID